MVLLRAPNTSEVRKLVSSGSPAGHTNLLNDLERVSQCCLLKTPREEEEADCGRGQIERLKTYPRREGAGDEANLSVLGLHPES